MEMSLSGGGPAAANGQIQRELPKWAALTRARSRSAHDPCPRLDEGTACVRGDLASPGCARLRADDGAMPGPPGVEPSGCRLRVSGSRLTLRTRTSVPPVRPTCSTAAGGSERYGDPPGERYRSDSKSAIRPAVACAG
jgi:hypothetical protein